MPHSAFAPQMAAWIVSAGSSEYHEGSSGLDVRLTDAVIVVFNAAMVDALNEDQKRRVLKESGEFARWEQVGAETPEDEEVLYPPFPMSTEGLRRLAHSAEQNDRRIEKQRRDEQAREANDE